MENKNKKGEIKKVKAVVVPSVIFSKESTTVVHKARDAGWVLSEEMEKARLTKIILNLTNGWTITLVHPKRQAILMKGGEPYPKLGSK